MSDVAAPSRSHRKPKGEGHSRRGEILSAAERIFVEHGYEGATIRKIADEVGLSSTALYMHFPDKAAILHEICREAFQALRDQAAAIETSEASPERRLRRILEGYIAFGLDNPNAYRLAYMSRPVELHDGAQSAARELGQDLFRAFEQVIEEVGAAGRLRGDTMATAQCLWAGVHGLVSLKIAKPYFDWVERSRLVEDLLDGLLTGFLKP